MSAERFTLRFLVLAMITGSISCTKEVSEDVPPPITDYRTYDVVPVAVKMAGEGYALLCKASPIERRASSVQLLAANGELGMRLDLDALPRRIENIDFEMEELLFTDFMPRPDGTFIVVGIGRQIAADNRSHMVVYQVAPDGTPIGSPSRRLLRDSTLVNTNDDAHPMKGAGHQT